MLPQCILYVAHQFMIDKHIICVDTRSFNLNFVGNWMKLLKILSKLMIYFGLYCTHSRKKLFNSIIGKYNICSVTISDSRQDSIHFSARKWYLREYIKLKLSIEIKCVLSNGSYTNFCVLYKLVLLTKIALKREKSLPFRNITS